MWSDKKPMILCTRSTSRSHARERECVKRLFASKIARVYEYQTWPTHLFEKCTRCAKVCGLFFSWLCFLDADWLCRQTLMDRAVVSWLSSESFEWQNGEGYHRKLPRSNIFKTPSERVVVWLTIAPTICVIFVCDLTLWEHPCPTIAAISSDLGRTSYNCVVQ